MHPDADVQSVFTINFSTGIPAIASEMFASRSWHCAPSTPHVCRPAEVLVTTLQVVAKTAGLLHALQR